MTEDPRQSALLELLALLIQARPEWVTTFLLGNEGPEVRAEAGKLADALAALALALPPAPLPKNAAGTDPLKARILASLAGRQKPRAALLVIDMLNDHLRPGSPVEVPRARDIVPALQTRLDAARAAGMPVIYVVDQHEEDDPELDLWSSHNVVGTKGAEVWPALAPHPGDVRVTKPTYSGFTASTLDEVLTDLAVDTLILTGCLTELGIAATAMDALQRGYAVQVPPDTQAGSGPLAEGVTMVALSLMPPFAPARKARLAGVHAKVSGA